MNREQAIQTIEGLFPADSPYNPEFGQKLLDQAKREVCGWRTEPTEILIRYAQLCEAEEGRQSRELLRRVNERR